MPTELWYPPIKTEKGNLNMADSWSAISHQASLAQDQIYATYSRYISVCLRASGLKLRDISNKYHDQLKSALSKNKKAGDWYSNITILDLYADFHSLASELCSARDHIAKIAAIHLEAPDHIDSLARLSEWFKKSSSNKDKKKEPIPSLLLSATGSKENPEWLLRLGDIRNLDLYTSQGH